MTEPMKRDGSLVSVATDVDAEENGFAHPGDVSEKRAAHDPLRSIAQQIETTSEPSAPHGVRWFEPILGGAALLAWFGLYAGGILVNTEPYRQEIANPASFADGLRSWSITLPFWTVTNIGMLACLAATLGAFGRRARFTLSEPHDLDDRSVLTGYASALIRGFGVYALVFAGLLVLATQALASPTQEGYLRLAATISVVAFYVGYDPEVFAALLERVKRLFEAPNQGAGTGRKSTSS